MKGRLYYCYVEILVLNKEILPIPMIVLFLMAHNDYFPEIKCIILLFTHFVLDLTN